MSWHWTTVEKKIIRSALESPSYKQQVSFKEYINLHINRETYTIQILTVQILGDLIFF